MVKNRGQIRNIARRLAVNLRHKGIKVNRLILYGSYAKDEARADSDIDIAVISSNFDKKNFLERQELLGEATFDLGEPVEMIGYGYKEFAHPGKLSFLSDIISSGKVVYQE